MTTLVVAATLLAACSADRPDTTGTRPHKLRASVKVDGVAQPVNARATVMLPARWEAVKDSAGRARWREGSQACTYTVDATIDVVQADAKNATAALRVIVPLAGARVLEVGQRGSASWRVAKLRGNGTQVRLDAVRVQPLRFVSSKAGRPTWLTARLHAASDKGDECHSGTYRDTLGPALGDALATLRARP